MVSLLTSSSLPLSLQVQSFTLKNGLKLFVLEKHDFPLVAYYTFFKAGSRYERPGITGISHFLEHMMFNGSRRYGPGEFDEILESNGGYSNAYTSHDVTAYYEIFPPYSLETVIKLESDRMSSLLLDPESFEAERKVIMEERRVSTDNDPVGKMEEVLEALAFFNSPYRWPVIGWMEDIKRISRKEMFDYYRSRYAPNNAIIFVVGDVRTRQVYDLIEKYYGNILAQPLEPDPDIEEPSQKGERIGYVRMEASLEAFLIGYKVPSMFHPDSYALSLLSIILSSGESCLFEKELVYEENLASSYYTYYYPRVSTTLFYIFVEVAPGKKLKRAQEKVEKILERIKREGVSARNLKKAKNRYLMGFYKNFETASGLANLLGRTQFFYGDWRKIYDFPGEMEKVTVEQIREVIRKYFRKENRSLVKLIPYGDSR